MAESKAELTDKDVARKFAREQARAREKAR